MKKFTFGILAYNQSNLIRETLESIKFQKLQYGEDIAVSLIVADDASSDGTADVVRGWFDENKENFENVELIANKKNKGTVANYLTILSKIDNENFKILAGDDLIGHRNLFVEYENLNSKKIKTYVRVELKNGQVYCPDKYLIKFYYHKTHSQRKGYHQKHFRKESYFHTPSTLYSKQLFVSANCEKNLEGYYLYEDEPTWYSMVKNEKDLDAEFGDHAIVLYRIHDKSVSNVPNTGFKNELKKLRKQYYDDSKGFERLYFVILMRFTNAPMYLNLGLYLEKITALKHEWICRHDKKYQVFKQKIEQQVEEEQRYYEMIQAAVSEND